MEIVMTLLVVIGRNGKKLPEEVDTIWISFNVPT
jgi:hypothetical protein